jgi:formate dehydrogenase major subunit
MHRLLALRARLRGSAGHLRADHPGRGFDSKVRRHGEIFLGSECVSCGACVQACPTATLTKNRDRDRPARAFGGDDLRLLRRRLLLQGRMRGEEVVRMVPYKDGKANRGHSCVKGRFAWGYATHKDRILKPMIRAKITDPWREVSAGTRRSLRGSEFKRIQAKYGRDSVGGITSSRCTNEETYLVQKLVRAGFGNNNVDTCARVCHSPTGYGLKATTFGTSAGTQDFDSVEQTDVVMVIGANPTDAHPVFASRMKKRLRAGRQADRDRSAPHRSGANAACQGRLSSAADARHQCRRAQRAGPCHRHRRPGRRSLRARALRLERFRAWARSSPSPKQPRGDGDHDRRRSGEAVARAARLYATGGNGAIYYGLGVTEHSQGSTTVMAIANLAMATGNIGRARRRRESAARPEQRAGLLRHGLVPARVARLSPRLDDAVRELFEAMWGVKLDNEPGLRIPNMFDAASKAPSRASMSRARTSLQSDPDTQHVTAALGDGMRRRAGPVPQRDGQLRPRLPARLDSSWKRTAPSPTPSAASARAQGDGAARPAMADWEVTIARQGDGLSDELHHPSRDHGRDRALTPTFAGVSYAKLDELGSVQWPCNEKAPEGTPVMHIDGFVRGKGKFISPNMSDRRANRPRFPLLLTTGRILSQYNVGAQTRRTANVVWHDEDRLEIHPHDAEQRGMRDGDWVGCRAAPARPRCAR